MTANPRCPPSGAKPKPGAPLAAPPPERHHGERKEDVGNQKIEGPRDAVPALGTGQGSMVIPAIGEDIRSCSSVHSADPRRTAGNTSSLLDVKGRIEDRDMEGDVRPGSLRW